MGSSCVKFVCHETTESDLYSLETKMKTLNEMSKSTKFSSLKQSFTYTKRNCFQLSETEIMEQENIRNNINLSLGRLKSFNFQENPQSFWLTQISSMTDSPMTVKSETRKMFKKKKAQRNIIRIQNLDKSFYIKKVNCQQNINCQINNNDEKSSKSILKSPLNKSANTLIDQKKVHFANETLFTTHRYSSPKKIHFNKIRRSLI